MLALYQCLCGNNIKCNTLYFLDCVVFIRKLILKACVLPFGRFACFAVVTCIHMFNSVASVKEAILKFFVTVVITDELCLSQTGRIRKWSLPSWRQRSTWPARTPGSAARYNSGSATFRKDWILLGSSRWHFVILFLKIQMCCVFNP